MIEFAQIKCLKLFKERLGWHFVDTLVAGREEQWAALN